MGSVQDQISALANQDTQDIAVKRLTVVLVDVVAMECVSMGIVDALVDIQDLAAEHVTTQSFTFIAYIATKYTFREIFSLSCCIYIFNFLVCILWCCIKQLKNKFNMVEFNGVLPCVYFLLL